MTKGFGFVLAAMMVIAIVAFSATLRVLEFRECRKLHPSWYCLLNR